jgi:hypothetical protein
MSSNTCSARAFSTGTGVAHLAVDVEGEAAHHLAGAERELELAFEDARVGGLKNSMLHPLSATPAATSTSTRSDCRRTGWSAPGDDERRRSPAARRRRGELRARLRQRAGRGAEAGGQG